MRFFTLRRNIFSLKISIRWWWAPLRSKLLICLLIGIPMGAEAQIEVKPPVFESVSVNSTNNGMVTIKWNPSPTSNVAGYIIQEERVSGQSFPIDTVYNPNGPFSYTFSYPKVLLGPVYFNLAAIDSSNNVSIRTKPSHISMFTSLTYDSCLSAINVKWTPYVGWNNLSKYSIFQIENNNQLTLIGDTLPEAGEYKVKGVKENQHYCYYVVAERSDGVTTSSSNSSCINTTAPVPPAFITGDFSQFQGTGSLKLQFTIDPATGGDLYRLFRSPGATDTYTALHDIKQVGGGTISYTDTLPSLGIYKYKLVYLNTCKNEGIGSIPINNILLKGSSEAMSNHLTWNTFATWPDGISFIEIYRSDANGMMQIIQTMDPAATELTDVISAQGEIPGNICYQVKASSNPDRYGKVEVSESNTFCLNMQGDVFIPNAFTPNGDGQNDIFKPSFAIKPTKFLFDIYNRYGFKIFETSDYSKGWDGKTGNGEKALEGGYIYYLRIENADGSVVEKRGSFSLIYP